MNTISRPRQVSLRMVPHIMSGMADKLAGLLETKDVFVEPDDDLRLNMHCAFKDSTINLKSPADFFIETLSAMMGVSKKYITNAHVRNLIADARTCAAELSKIIDTAAREADKKPHISRKHFNHVFRNGRRGGNLPAIRIRAMRSVTRAAMRFSA